MNDMKRYLLMMVTALVFGVTAASAQKFEFQYHGQSVADGGTVTITAVEDDYGFGELCCATNPSSNPNNGLILKLLDGTTGSGNATLTIEHNALDAKLQWCMGKECVLMTNKTTLDKAFSTTNGIVQVQFDADDIKSQGSLLATLTATVGGETHSVKIKFTNEPQAGGSQLWWGYFSDSDAESGNFDGLGTGAKEDFEAAIYIPANHSIAGNSTIKGIRLWFNRYLPNLTSVKVWIAKSLTANMAGADYVQDVQLSSLQEGANEIMLNTPYPVNGEGVYVGYTVKTISAVFPIMCGGEWVENSFFIRGSQNVPDWEVLDNFGKLALQLLLEGATLNENSAMASDFGSHFVLKGETVQVPITITNLGTNPLSSISYTITTNGSTSTEQTISLDNLAFNKSVNVTIPFPSDEDTRRYEKKLTVTKANGVANESSTNSAYGSLVTILEKPAVVPVVEEFTGTWCGWCPIGFDGMEKTHEQYGSQVVLIAVHARDVMETPDYAPIANTVSSYPSAYVDRLYSIYPEFGEITDYINYQMKRTTLGTIGVSAAWKSAAQKSIVIDTQTKFVYSDDNGQYGIAYVLVQDGMKGTGSDWAQTNNLSKTNGYEKDFAFWYNSPSKVSGLEFNHVAVAAWNIWDGGNVPSMSSFSSGEVISNSFEANISSNTLIQDESKLKVVALLIDQTTGAIVNAAQTAILDAGTGIATASRPSSDATRYYSVGGKQLSAPVKGMNILRMSDGTVKKMVVR